MAKGKKTGGRSKGTVNKVNAGLKEMITGALTDAGGQAYLRQQAEENPGPFMALLGKILPRDVVLAGDPENPIRHAISNSAVQAISDLVGAIARARAVISESKPDPQ